MKSSNTPDRQMRLVTSVRVEPAGAQERVLVWNDGALAGVLVVKAGDGGPIAARLIPLAKVSAQIQGDESVLFWPGNGPESP